MITILSTVVVLGVLIFVHELGHFLAAKSLGVKVERFSLGFPPKMIGKKVGETEYILSWIPLGGYVKMFGENPDEENKIPPEEQHRSFSHKPAWGRFLIVLAGPAFNFLFALLVFWAIFAFSGVEHLTAEIGRVRAGGPAAGAGIQGGDVVIAIDGAPIRFFDQIDSAVRDGRGREIELAIQRGQASLLFKVQPETVAGADLFGEKTEYFDIGVDPYLSPVVGEVQDDMPAAAAGLEAGDKITALDGKPVRDWYDVLDGIRAAGGRAVQVSFERDNRAMAAAIIPKIVVGTEASGEKTETPMIGISRKDDVVLEKVGPLDAVYYGTLKTWELCRLTVLSVAKLIQRKISVKTLGGPIFIAEMAGKQAKAGFLSLVSLAALLSLNLGILNLLPIPVLDGGHLLFFGLEMVFRRPVSLNIRERAQQAGMVFLILFMAFVFYNDLARIISRGADEENAPKTRIEQRHDNPEPGNVDSGR
ncbi:MAG: RIP metalloprotease RseP [Pseudomonadota bacterium]